MSERPDPFPATVVVGFLSADRALMARSGEVLAAELGGKSHEIPPFPFENSEYYREEMGDGLFRSWQAFHTLCRRESLAQLKQLTNEMEQSLKKDGRRRINIDPGLLSLENFCLATTKNFAHRVYLGRQIFAEVTLLREGRAYKPLPWTYPEYGQADFLSWADSVRDLYHQKMQKKMTRGELFWPSKV